MNYDGIHFYLHLDDSLASSETIDLFAFLVQ